MALCLDLWRSRIVVFRMGQSIPEIVLASSGKLFKHVHLVLRIAAWKNAAYMP